MTRRARGAQCAEHHGGQDSALEVGTGCGWPSAPGGVAQPLSDFRRRLAFALVLVATMGASLVFSILPGS